MNVRPVPAGWGSAGQSVSQRQKYIPVGKGRGKLSYWAPVDLFWDGPLAVDERPMDQKGEVVAIKALPVKLTFNNKGESIDFRFDARHVLRDREISSVWPWRALFAAVEPGSYDLRLVLETTSGTVSLKTGCGARREYAT